MDPLLSEHNRNIRLTDNTTPIMSVHTQFTMNDVPSLSLDSLVAIQDPLHLEPSEAQKKYLKQTKHLEYAIIALVSKYAEIFGNFEMARGSITIHLGNGKFWKLDMGVMDINEAEKQ